MRTNRSIPDSIVIPVLTYDDVREAVAWLTRVFGFRERLQIGDHRSQMETVSGGHVVAAQGNARGSRVLVRVEDLDAHYARVKESGAKIVSDPTDYPYGERQYSVEDLGGHGWTFSETIADAAPSDWGGVLVD